MLENKIKELEEENKALKVKCEGLEGALRVMRETNKKLVADKSIPPWMR